MATVSTSGVLADEKRRVAVPRLAEARNPPTGASAPSGGRENPGGDASHDRPEEAHGHHQADRGQLRGRRGGLGSARGGRHGEQRDRAGERQQRRRSGAPGRAAAARPRRRRARRVGGTRAARRPAARTASSAVASPPATAAAAGIQSACTAKLAGRCRGARARVRAPRRARPRARCPRQSRPAATIAASHAIMRRIWPGRRGDRAQERDLALALLDREAQRAGDDEHGDEQRQPAERRRDRDQGGARLLELGVLGLRRAPHRSAPCTARARRRAARSARRRSKPGPARTPIASTRPGWPASRVASASVRKIAACGVTGAAGERRRRR